MVEMRWTTKGLVNGIPPKGGIPIAFTVGYPTWMVLQYRVAENLNEHGLHETVWSEWMDVE